MNTIETALYWQSLGIVCLPAYENSKALLKGTRVRHYIDNSPSLPQFVEWWQNKPNNICLIANDNLIVIDFDSVPAYAKWRNEYQLDTYTVRSKRGYHTYFWIEQPVNIDHSSLPENVEVKCNGSVIMIPPSKIDDFQYRAIDDTEILQVDRIQDVIEVCDLSASRTFQSKSKNLTVNVYGNNNNVSIGDNGFFSFTLDAPKAQNLFQQVKESLPIITYLEKQEPVKSSDNGRFYMAYCPSHSDENRSLSIDTVNNLVSCFKPGCPLYSQRGFDVIGLHSILTGLSNGQAAKELGGLLDL